MEDVKRNDEEVERQPERKKFRRKLSNALGLIDTADPQTYKPFKKIKKRRIRKFKLVVLSLYLLIILLSIVLHPYIMIVLTDGFRPFIRQPAFAHAYRHYINLLNYASTNEMSSEDVSNLHSLVISFNNVLDLNDKILCVSLFTIPINIFFTLCLAFRFTRPTLNVLLAPTHIGLGIANLTIVGLITTIYFIQRKKYRKIFLFNKEIFKYMSDLEIGWLKMKKSQRLGVHLKHGGFSSKATYVNTVICIVSIVAILHIILGLFFLVRWFISRGNSRTVKGK